MPYHLPVLLNPLLNAVFNCPSPKVSSLKQVFSQLEKEKFFILVPNSQCLLEFQDLDSGLELAELCYHYDFVASHIVVIGKDTNTSSAGQKSFYNKEFKTLNGKKIVIRYQNSSVITSDGFSDRKRVDIDEINVIPTFNDYLSGSRYTPVVYINKPLCGDLVAKEDYQVFSKVSGNKYAVPSVAPLSFDVAQKQVLQFEQRIQSLLDVAERLALTFHLTKAKIKKANDIESIKNEWKSAQDSIHQIVSFDKRLNKTENLDSVIYDYTELKLFTDVQQQLSEITHHNELEHKFDFSALKSISLNQVSTMFYQKQMKSFSLKNVIKLEQSVHSALECFKTIDLKNNHAGKLDVLSSTMKILGTEIDGRAIDADTLLSLVVLLICRSQVSGLMRTLAYLNNFAFNETAIKFGIQGYVVSTFEAALSYFHDDTVKSLLAKCSENRYIWDHIQNDKTIRHERLKSNLYLRTDNGESLLSLCIQAHANETLEYLLTNFENEYPLEDIIEDRDFTSSTLLIQALQAQNSVAVEIISTIVLNSCTQSEIVEFLNSPNLHNRTAAHYIMQEVSLVETVGEYLNWEHTDINGHSPLFAVFRSYDTPNYEEMVTKILDEVIKWYKLKGKPLNFRHHEDPKGNTLLHVMKSGIHLLLKLPGINVNKPDLKGLTPLMTYAKYNRLDNIETIMRDSRLLWDSIQQPLFMTCIDFTKSPPVTDKILEVKYEKSDVIIHSLRFEDGKWKIWITFNGTENKYSLALIRQYLRYFKIKYPWSFQPIEALTEELKNLGMLGVPSILRLQSYHTLRKLSLVFTYMNTRGELWLDKEEKELKSLLDVPTPRLTETERFVKLEPEEINGIQGFLKYNVTEFVKLKSCVTFLKKLSIVQFVKSRDVKNSQKMLFSLGNQFTDTEIADCFSDFRLNGNFDLSYHEFIRNLGFLEDAISSLLNHIEALLAKVNLWWKHYGEFMELKKEWNKNFPKDVTPPSTSSMSFIDTYIEGKRSRFKSKLSNQMKMSSLNLKKLGGEIKGTNENLAVEINLFIEYKDQFYEKHLIRSVVDRKIREYKQIIQQLTETAIGHHV